MRMRNYPHALYGVFALAGCALLAWGLTVSVAPAVVRAQSRARPTSSTTRTST